MIKIKEAVEVLKALGLPKAQHNERTALCLLALLNLIEDKDWSEAENPLIGITPIMEFAKEKYGKIYAPNTRETFRRFSMHQLVDAGIALINPDQLTRAVNSPKTVYQIEPTAFNLLKTFGTAEWNTKLPVYLKTTQTLVQQYAKEREMEQVPVTIAEEDEIQLSPGIHSILIKAIIEEFASRFVPGAQLIYAGDTGNKWGYFNQVLLNQLGVEVDSHGKMPDVIIYYPEKNWLLLIEAVTSHGPVDGKRYEELKNLFDKSTAPLVFVTAFPSRSAMAPYLPVLSWETEVWCADAPTHLIHLDGVKFLGPYKN